MNHLGITGSRDGASERQKKTLSALMSLWIRITTDPSFHHGDCEGVDDESVTLAFVFGMNLVCHPPLNEKYRSSSTTRIPYQEIREPKEYMHRNRDIVNESSVLIAVPDTFSEVLRSGTWSTVRYAMRIKKLVIVIWPDGSMSTPE